MVSLEDQVVIVTGTSSGIGRATALAFARAGARVVSVARRAELLETLESELAQYGRPVLSIPTDLSEDEGMERLVKTVIQTYGRVDVLVNNAGLSIGGPLQEQNPAIIRQMVNLNVYAPMRLTQLVLPHMLERKQGHIVNVASVAAIFFSPGQTSYSPTRAAMLAFSKALRRELDGSGVRVSCVLPGWTLTGMTEKMSLNAMRAAGLFPPFTTIDSPETPARAIVNTVRNNRAFTILGGSGWVWADLFERISPALMNIYMRWFIQKEKFLRSMKDLGAH